GRYWRKNTNQDHCGRSSRGVDLNRNFSFAWNCCGGSSGRECSSTYRGPSPASEPETLAIQDYLVSQFTDWREPELDAASPLDADGVYIDIHSYSELVLWPWGFEGKAPNEFGLATLGRKLAWFNGYDPIQAVELYPTDGTTDDFVYGELGIAAYTFELGTEFFQSCNVFENEILPDNLPALLYAAKTASAPYMWPKGPDTSEVSATTDDRSTAVLTATITSVRDGSSTPVVEAEAYVGTPPWDDSAPAPIALNAVDSIFDSQTEYVTGTLRDFPPGRTIIYVRGRDADGDWGVVSATFLEVE
ncbi:MAG: M14 family zinc carboxypeptidase, partial [Myxococcota bacterium]